MIIHRLLPLLVIAISASAQTTQGLISGRLVNSVSGQGVAGARVAASATGASEIQTVSDASGYYYLPLLSPSTYRIRVTATAYQSQEIQELTLPVAARLDIDFRLRPLSDVWEAGQYNSVFLPGSKTIVTFFGPDVDPSRSGSFDAQKGRTGALESTISSVIDSGQLDGLPLLGRDVYTMLATEPGVTSDAATARGLGLSINGQRPSASNYLLDGLENNNYLITGPLVTVAPEAIQEYRISTNNFSAEYGRTSGFLANAITRTGTNQFHGTAYFYLENDKLNANGFQENLAGISRRSLKQLQPGFVVTGPILHDRLFFSSSYEFLRNRSEGDPATYLFPNAPLFLNTLTYDARSAFALVTKYQTPYTLTPLANNPYLSSATISQPGGENRHLAVERVDQASRDGKNRVMGRLLLSRVTEPNFIWTPYPDFISPLHQNTYAIGGSYLRQIRPSLTNEARVSVSSDDLYWTRPHPEIPTLLVQSGQPQPFPSSVSLPGSPAFYEYQNTNRTQELLDNVILNRGRHLITAGAGLLFRSSDGHLTAGRDGEYIYSGIGAFGQDSPSFLSVAINRLGTPLTQPNYGRTFSYKQSFLFAQDTFKVTPRLTINYGLRYERFGGPSNTGATKDALVQMGSGPTLAAQLPGATLVSAASNSSQQLFGTDNGDFGVRVGASYDLTGSGHTVLRGAYGIFYDRPYDNLWENLRNNSIVLNTFTIPAASYPFDELTPLSAVLPKFAAQRINPGFPSLTLINPDLKNGRVHSYFAGVQHRFSDTLTMEVNGLGSYGRRLITTDIINRPLSVNGQPYNSSLPEISYRDSNGSSDYNALTALVRYRGSRGFFQSAYTWSHTIDTQSDVLTGDFFNLSYASAGSNSSSALTPSTYVQQFNQAADRGNSDFDQRHNFVTQGYWTPAPLLPDHRIGLLLKDWNFGTLLAIRSGFPFNLRGQSPFVDNGGTLIGNRPNLINPSQVYFSQPQAVAGGVRLLNLAAFSLAPTGLGNLGRNALTGPGFYNLDLAVGRSFPLRWLGEGSRLNFRADLFNVLNHANLGNPSTLPDASFGIATYGRQAAPSGFPAVTPLNETPRQIQLSVRVQF